jgi:hypothetical protein
MATARLHISGGAKKTTLTADIQATDLTCGIADATGWPDGSVGEIPVIFNYGLSDEEHALAISRTGTTLTFASTAKRGVDNTSAQPHRAGATVTHGLFGSMADDTNAFLSAPTATGQVAVSTAASQWSAGVAPQASTHGAPDTDSASTALHHTLGTGANQATPGTHPAVASGVHGVTGALVGTTDAQTLTNKTLTNPAINAANGSLVLPQGTSPAQTAEGSIVWDTDDDLLTVGTGAGRTTLVDTSATQTLAGKTLTQPTIADLTNVSHDHGSTAKGGAIVAAALPASVPRGTMGYAERTTTGTASSSPLVSLILVSVAFTAVAGRRYEIIGHVPEFTGATAGNTARLVLRRSVSEGATEYNYTRVRISTSGGVVEDGNQVMTIRNDFSSGTVTIELFLSSTGDGVTAQASTTDPIWLLVKDIGV